MATPNELIGLRRRLLPLALNFIALGSLVFFLWRIVPHYATLYAGLGESLPWLTRCVISASNFIGAYIVFFIVLLFPPLLFVTPLLIYLSKYNGVRRTLLWLLVPELLLLALSIVAVSLPLIFNIPTVIDILRH